MSYQNRLTVMAYRVSTVLNNRTLPHHNIELNPSLRFVLASIDDRICKSVDNISTLCVVTNARNDPASVSH